MLIAHIVGINNTLKNKFIKDIDNISDKIIIIDLDNLSKKIIFMSEYSKIHDEFINTKDKTLLSQLGNFWKNKFTNDINLLLEQNKTKYILLIGLITFYLDHRIKINLTEPLKDKFFVNIDIKKYISDIITYNIDTYRNDIINGKFPLKYLDYNFIKIQREELKAHYMTKNYKIKNYDAIINWIYHTHENILNNIPVNTVYYASYKRYENKIDMLVGDTIVGYNYKWLALASLLSPNIIKRGVTYKNGENIPVLKELTQNGFLNLNKCCYLYELYPEKKIDNFRYIITDTNFINRYYVSNIKTELNTYNTIYQSFTTVP